MFTRQIFHTHSRIPIFPINLRYKAFHAPFISNGGSILHSCKCSCIIPSFPSHVFFRPSSTSSKDTTSDSTFGRQPPPIQQFYTNIDKLKETDEFFLVEKSESKSESNQNTKVEYKYEITNKTGEILLCVDQLYESFPPRFDLKIYEPNGNTLVIHKLLQNLSSRLLIISPGSQYLGSIEEKVVLDEDKPPLFEIRNNEDIVQAVVLSNFPDSLIGLRRSVKILSPDRSNQIGKMCKKWSGFNDNLVISIQIPKEILDAKFRVSLVALCILLNNRFIR